MWPWLVEQITKVYNTLETTVVAFAGHVLRVITPLWTYLKPSLVHVWHLFAGACLAYGDEQGRRYDALVGRFETRCWYFGMSVYTKVKPTVDFLSRHYAAYYAAYYPRFAPYIEPCILVLFRFIRWSYKAVNRPFDRFVAYYIWQCRRRGIYVEEENLRARWLTDGWMFILFTGTIIYGIICLIMHLWTRM